MRHVPHCLALSALAASLLTRTMHAQAGDASPPARSGAPVAPPPAVAPRVASAPACVRALPGSAFTRLPVYVYAEVADSADRAARPAVDLVADAVAGRLRTALGGGAGTLPAADSLMWQMDLAGGLRVTAARDGRVSWRDADAPTGVDSSAVSERLLDRALRTLADAGELFVPAELFRGDSLVYELRLVHPERDAGGRQVVRRRNPAAAFTLSVAPEVQAEARPGEIGRNVRYPAQLQAGGFQGHVVVEFVVDSAGRADPATVRDPNAHVTRTLAPELRQAYRDFFAAGRQAVLKTRFAPATVGGCAVRQRVRQPMTWALAQ